MPAGTRDLKSFILFIYSLGSGWATLVLTLFDKVDSESGVSI